MDKFDQSVSATGLTKEFGTFTAVKEVDVEVYKGEIFGFLGPNGSGKTTTIRMMLGLLKPTRGSVEILGIPVAEKYYQIRHLVGYMSQRFSLYNDLSVLQNLNFYGAAYGLSHRLLNQRIKNALEISNLIGQENQKTKDLSGGWRQRLALSAAILHRPKVLFLDEPTAGVDPISRRAFWDLLYDLISQEVTVFVTTHYMDEAEHCHRLAFIQQGEIIAYGSPEEIKKQYMKHQILEITPINTSKTLEILKQIQDSGHVQINEVELFGSQIHVVSSNYEELKTRITEELVKIDIKPGEMTLIDASLEDVFIASMKK